MIARDGRLSGPVFSQALCEGLLTAGCDVIDLGMVPTPLLYYATHVQNIRSGIMLTGSHNPPNYNGLKMVLDGHALTEEQIQLLYQKILVDIKDANCLDNPYPGKYIQLEITQSYIQAVTEKVQLTRPLKVVVDAGNGVAGGVAPALFRALGCEVQELFCEIDGRFPHHHADPSHVDNLQDLIRTVKENDADIGLAFDGDGDRLGVVTKQGEIIWPDRLLMLFARSILSQVPGAKIIFDVKCTDHLAKLVTSLGGQPIMWKTGHSLIKAKLAETQALLAGEMSGHFFFKDNWYGFDDALYASARLLQILAAQTQDSDAVFATIPNSVNTPELKIMVTDAEKFQLMQQLIEQANFTDAQEINTIDGLRVNFADGWGLLRPSNTTPYLVLRFEAIDHAILTRIQALFRQWMLSVRPDLVLPF